MDSKQTKSMETFSYSKKRWLVLAVFCCSNFLVSLNGFLYPPIASTFEKLYGVGANAINLISIISLVTPFLMFPFAMYFSDRRDTVEEAYYIAMVSNMICSWVRYFVPAVGQSGYLASIITQFFISFTHPFLLVLPPKVSGIYFPLNERNLSTSLGTICGLIGLGLGMVLSPFFVNDVQTLFLVQAAASTFPVLVSFFVLDIKVLFQCGRQKTQVDDKLQNGVEREPFFRTIARICKNGAFIRLVLIAGTGVGTVETILTLVEQVAQPSFNTPQSIIIICGSFFLCGTVGAIACGILCDITGDQIKIGRIMLPLAGVAVSVSMIGWYLDNSISVYIGMAFAGLFGFGILPLAVELGVEYTFVPGVNSEATVCGFVQLVVNIVAAVLIIVSTPGNLLESKDVPLLWEALFLVTILAFFTLPKRYHRLDHNNNNKVQVEECPASDEEQAVSPV